MNIEILRGRPHILVIDGRPMKIPKAAKKLSLTEACLQKRLERGTSLTKPMQRQVRES